MKSIKNIFVTAAFMSAASAMATVPENAYLIGSATPAQWNTEVAVPMHKDGNTFLFEGNLIAGELKILTENNFECPTFKPLTNGVAVTTEGLQNETVAYQSGDPDNKWNISTPGKYRITLNVAEDPTAENGGTISFEYMGETNLPDHVYLIGGATFSGWDTGSAIEMKRDGNVFTYDGILIGSDNGEELKFLTGNCFEFRNYYAPSANYPIGEEAIKDQTVNYGPDDLKWSVKKTGYYHLTLSIKADGTESDAGTFSAEYVENPQTYMLGLAAGEFDSNTALAMEAGQDGSYSWNGELNYAASDGNPDHANKQFKFCFPTGDWNRVIFLIPASATEAGVTQIGEGTYDLKWSYEFGGQTVMDSFFGLNDGEKGKYQITVNPSTLKMTLKKNPDTGVSEIDSAEGDVVEEIYDLNGRKLSREGVASGIYIVRKSGVTRKVIIK